MVENWKANLDKLAVCDMVGVDWQNDKRYPHFSGNFWMARADWINRLEKPSDYQKRGGPDMAGNRWERMAAEVWLGSKAYHHVESLCCSDEVLWEGNRVFELLRLAGN